MNITEELEKLAQKKGVDIRKARRTSGISRSTWHRWKNGADPKTGNVARVREAILKASKKGEKAMRQLTAQAQALRMGY